MEKRFFYFLGLVMLFWAAVPGKVFSQEADHNARPPFDLKLFVSDSVFYEAHMEATSYVLNGRMVQVFPGEKIYIEADLLKDSLVNLKVVPEFIIKKKRS